MGECMNLNLLPLVPRPILHHSRSMPMCQGQVARMNLSLLPRRLPAETVVAVCLQSVLDMLLTEQLLRINLECVLPDHVRIATCFCFLCLVVLLGLGVHKTTTVACGALFRTALFGLPPRFVEVTNAVDWTGSCVLSAVGR